MSEFTKASEVWEILMVREAIKAKDEGLWEMIRYSSMDAATTDIENGLEISIRGLPVMEACQKIMVALAIREDRS